MRKSRANDAKKQKDKNVAIIVSNYNGVGALYKNKSILDWVFSTLKLTTYKNFEVIMADDKSTDNSVDYVKRKYPWVDIVTMKENGLFAKNNNNGMRHAIKKYDPDFVLLLNNDIIIRDKDWLTKLVEDAENMNAGITGSLLTYPSGKIQHAGVEKLIFPDDRARHKDVTSEYTKIEYINAVVFALAMISRKVINKIGLLDENFMHGLEDTDYCVRAEDAGFKILYDGRVRITHLEGYTSNKLKPVVAPKGKYTDRFFYYRLKNIIYYHRKHFNSASTNTAVVFYTLGSCIITTTKGHPELRDHIPERLGMWARAYKDAKKR